MEKPRRAEEDAEAVFLYFGERAAGGACLGGLTGGGRMHLLLVFCRFLM